MGRTVALLTAVIIREQGRQEEGLGPREGGGPTAGRPIVHAVRHLPLCHDLRPRHGHRQHWQISHDGKF